MTTGGSIGLSAADRERLSAVEARAASGGAADVAALVAWLDDPSWVVRRGVVAALARAGDAAVPPLVAVILAARDHEARLAAAVDALVASRGDVESALIEVLTSASVPAILCDAVQVLGRRKSSAALGAIGSLVAHADDNVAVAAIEALGRIRGPATCAPLIVAVESGSFFRTFPAMQALGDTGDLRAVAPLSALLESAFYAPEAARALGSSGRPDAVAPLLALLDRPDERLARAGIAALVELARRHRARSGDAPVVPDLVRGTAASTSTSARLGALSAGATAEEQLAIATVLAWIADEGAVQVLLDMLGAEPPVAAAAGAAIEGLGARVGQQVDAALRAGSSVQRARILPRVANGGVSHETLVACLRDGDSDVRALACDALARTGNPRDVAAIFALLGDADARVGQAAVAAIQSLGSAETKALALAQARVADPRLRRAAVRILSYFGYPEALPTLIAAVDDPDPRIGEVALGGLSLIGDDASLAALLAAAGSFAPRLRGAAMRALGGTSTRAEVVAALRAGLTDLDAWVRYYACQSIGRLSITAAVSEVVACMADEAGQVRVAAVEALALLGGDESERALAAASRSDDPDARRAALVGLGIAHRPASLETVREATASGDVATRLVALSALARFDAPEVAADLAGAATDPDESVRAASLSLLAARPGQEAARQLVQLVGNPVTRETAVAALGAPAPGRLEEILTALGAADDDLAGHLASTLARVPPPGGTDALAAALSMDNVAARRAAAGALAAMGTAHARQLLDMASASDTDEEVRRISARDRPR